MNFDTRLWQRSIELFQDYMKPLVTPMGRSERRVAATRYVEGLLLPGERKSFQPMAQRLGVDAQSLQQFVTDSPWEEREIWRAIRQEVVPHLGELEAWVVDETGWLKQGKHSVGVSHQYCGSVGKTANCQVSVELGVSDGWVVAPVAGRLYLPESWTRDRKRRDEARVPAEIQFQTKPEIALDLIREALADGVSRAPVLGDSVYGDSAAFRQGLRDLRVEFFLQVSPRGHKGWTEPVETVLKKKRRVAGPEAAPPQTLEEIAASIPARKWKKCRWRTAGGSERETRLVWVKVYLQDNLSKGGELEEVWLVVDWPEKDAEPYHYYLAHLHRDPNKALCLTLSRSRWQIEQYFQRSKDDLGLDHFEGRHWRGFHHHLVLSAIAYLFVLILYLRNKKNFWVDVGTDAPDDPALLAEVDRILQLLRHQVR